MQETQETRVQSLGQEDPLEEGMATHSSTLAWRSPWTEAPGGPHRVRHDWSDRAQKGHAGWGGAGRGLSENKIRNDWFSHFIDAVSDTSLASLRLFCYWIGTLIESLDSSWMFYVSKQIDFIFSSCFRVAVNIMRTITFLNIFKQNLNIYRLKKLPKLLWVLYWWVKRCAQSHLTLRDPLYCSQPGSSVHGIFQLRTWERVAISFSKGSSQPKDQTCLSRIAGRLFTRWAIRETPKG